ncbi:hypothetical protein GCM10028791_16800 [Echinicola sediminis]
MKTTNFRKIKAMIEVMGKYGISPISKVKKSDFVKDMGFDKVYLGGLIYDVEDALNVQLKEEEVDLINCPSELISYMVEYRN